VQQRLPSVKCLVLGSTLRSCLHNAAGILSVSSSKIRYNHLDRLLQWTLIRSSPYSLFYVIFLVCYPSMLFQFIVISFHGGCRDVLVRPRIETTSRDSTHQQDDIEQCFLSYRKVGDVNKWYSTFHSSGILQSSNPITCHNSVKPWTCLAHHSAM